MKKLLRSITEVIGETPMLNLSRITKYYGVEGRIYAKLEYLNPGYSKKDRVALQMILDAEASGELKPGQPVVELTSGNTGTGLSIVCAATGHPFIACMSKGNSLERARMMRALGAEVVLVDQMPTSVYGQVSGDDLALVEQEAQRICAARGAFRADQFQLEACNRAHENRTAIEMIEQADGDIDAFVDFAGSGSTFGGVSRGLKKYNPAIHCYVAEPEAAAVYAAKEIKNLGAHKIQGAGYSMDLPLIDKGLIDGFIQITDDDAADKARNLARLEGVFAGYSSGANLDAAIQLLKGTEKGKTVVITINDSGLKYLSTDLYPQFE